MEQTLIKNIMIGQKVKVQGKSGIILNRGGDDVYIRFDDGAFGQFQIEQVEPELVETRLKSARCQCGAIAYKIMKEDDADGGETIYACNKCSQRFSTNIRR